VTKKIHAVGIIFERPDGKILLLYRHENELEGNRWGLVGGTILKVEAPKDSAVREIKEEINIDINVSDLIFIRTYDLVYSEFNVTFELFKIKINNIQKISLGIEENVKYKWFSPKEAYNRPDLLDGLYSIFAKEYKLNVNKRS
jgi:8-oxo-dGTP pyrophosphatase MutT (NUDIX family)